MTKVKAVAEAVFNYLRTHEYARIGIVFVSGVIVGLVL